MARPMLDRWEMPGVEAIFVDEQRRLVEHAVPGRVGSVLQDMGSRPARVVVTGSLYLDEDRDGFLKEIRERYAKADPVTFVADITTASTIGYVVIRALEVRASAQDPNRFRYAVQLVESEPPKTGGSPTSAVEAAVSLEADETMAGMSAMASLSAATGLPDMGSIAEGMQTPGLGALGENLGMPDLAGTLAGLEVPDLANLPVEIDDLSQLVDMMESLDGSSVDLKIGDMLAPVETSMSEGEAMGEEVGTALQPLDEPVAQLAAGAPDQAPIEADVTQAEESLGGAKAELEQYPAADVEQVAGQLESLPLPDLEGSFGSAAASFDNADNALGQTGPEQVLNPLTRASSQAETALAQDAGKPLAELNAQMEATTTNLGAKPHQEVAKIGAPLDGAATAIETDGAVPAAAQANEQAAGVGQHLDAGGDAGNLLTANAQATMTGLTGPVVHAQESGAAKIRQAQPGNQVDSESRRTLSAYRPGGTPVADKVGSIDWNDDSAVNGLQADLQAIRAATEQLRDTIIDAATHVRDTIQSLKPEDLRKPVVEALRNVISIEVIKVDPASEALLGLLRKLTAEVEKIDPTKAGAELIRQVQKIRTDLQQIDLQAKLQQAAGGLGKARDAAGAIRQVRTRAMVALQQALDKVTAVLAEVRQALEQIRDAVQGELNELRDALAKLHQDAHALQEKLMDGLRKVEAKVAEGRRFLVGDDGNGGAAGRLKDALEQFAAEVQKVKIADVEKAVHEQLKPVTDKLQAFNFQPAIKLALDQVEELRKQIASIKVDELNPVARGALGAAKVLLVHEANQNLPGVRDKLVERWEKVCEEPYWMLTRAEDKLDEALAGFRKLEPSPLVMKVQYAYEDLLKELKKVEPSQVLKPFDEAHRHMLAAVDRLEPTPVMAPVMDRFFQLRDRVDRLAPSRIIDEADKLRERLEKELDKLGVEQLPQRLAEFLDEARELIGRLDPGVLLDPLRQAASRLGDGIDRINPDRIYRAVIDLSGKLEQALERLQDSALEELARVIDAAMAELDKFADAAADQIDLALVGLQEGLDKVNPGAQVERIRRLAWRELKEAIDKAVVPNDRLAYLTACKVFVRECDPLKVLAPALQAYEESEALIRALLDDWRKGTAELRELSGKGKEAILSALPLWMLERPIVKERIIAEFRASTAGKMVEELKAAYAPLRRFKERLPGQIDQLEAELKGILFDAWMTDLDPVALTKPLLQAYHDVRDELLEVLDLSELKDEFAEIMAELKAGVEAINPTTIFITVWDSWRQIREAVAALDPAQFAGPLDAIYREQIVVTVEDLSPLHLVEPELSTMFAHIDQQLSKLDVRNLARPVTRELDRLAEELEQGMTTLLGKVQALPRAIPIDVPIV